MKADDHILVAMANTLDLCLGQLMEEHPDPTRETPALVGVISTATVLCGLLLGRELEAEEQSVITLALELAKGD